MPYPSMQQQKQVSLLMLRKVHSTSPLYFPDLPHQGAIRMRNIKSCQRSSDPIIEHTGEPSGDDEHYPSDKDLSIPKIKHSKMDIACLTNNQDIEAYKVDVSQSYKNSEQIFSPTNHNEHLIHNFFTTTLNIPVDKIDHSKYLNIAHEMKCDKETQENMTNHT